MTGTENVGAQWVCVVCQGIVCREKKAKDKTLGASSGGRRRKKRAIRDKRLHKVQVEVLVEAQGRESKTHVLEASPYLLPLPDSAALNFMALTVTVSYSLDLKFLKVRP